jgi:hypothetical protein
MDNLIKKTVDEQVQDIMEQLRTKKTDWGEPEAWVDVAHFDDEDSRMLSLHIYENHEDLKPEEYNYTAEVLITTNNDFYDNSTELRSPGIGEQYIRQLVESALKFDLMAVQV